MIRKHSKYGTNGMDYTKYVTKVLICTFCQDTRNQDASIKYGMNRMLIKTQNKFIRWTQIES